MQVVFLADTHNYEIAAVPDGDMVIHCGDATGIGTIPEVAKFLTWYGRLPHRHKIFVAGNHDWLFQTDQCLAKQMCLDCGVTYLEDRGTIIEGLHIYGTPWQPQFCDWAFNLDELDLEDRFMHIPGGLDILVTHCPPRGILDESNFDFKARHIGPQELLDVVLKQKPRVHAFGHNHGGYGQKQVGETLFINAAVCNPGYAPVNRPICVELSPKEKP